MGSSEKTVNESDGENYPRRYWKVGNLQDWKRKFLDPFTENPPSPLTLPPILHQPIPSNESTSTSNGFSTQPQVPIEGIEYQLSHPKIPTLPPSTKNFIPSTRKNLDFLYRSQLPGNHSRIHTTAPPPGLYTGDFPPGPILNSPHLKPQLVTWDYSGPPQSLLNGYNQVLQTISEDYPLSLIPQTTNTPSNDNAPPKSVLNTPQHHVETAQYDDPEESTSKAMRLVDLLCYQTPQVISYAEPSSVTPLTTDTLGKGKSPPTLARNTIQHHTEITQLDRSEKSTSHSAAVPIPGNCDPNHQSGQEYIDEPRTHGQIPTQSISTNVIVDQGDSQLSTAWTSVAPSARRGESIPDHVGEPSTHEQTATQSLATRIKQALIHKPNTVHIGQKGQNQNERKPKRGKRIPKADSTYLACELCKEKRIIGSRRI